MHGLWTQILDVLTVEPRRRYAKGFHIKASVTDSSEQLATFNVDCIVN